MPDTFIVENMSASFPRFTPNTITTPSALRREIEVVCRAGVAFDREEHTTGISAVGAVLGDFGTERLAVSVPVPTQRFLGRQDELAAALRGWVERVDGALRSVAG
jgi:DNA-binding IclR family transcriptional regulator